MAPAEESMRLTPPAAGPVVVAVSAGADSTALALWLADAKVGPLHLAHVQHGFRPGAAAQEVFALRALSRRIGAPLHLLPAPPPAAWQQGEKIPEAAARAQRIERLADLARRVGASVIALAHHARDQLETQLLQLRRGGALRALAAMPVVRTRAGLLWWRPLLCVAPERLRALVASAALPWVEDASNDDLRLRRNAVRHLWIPQLAREDDPLLARAAALSARARKAMERIAGAATTAPFDAGASARIGAVRRDARALARVGPALLREFVRVFAQMQLGERAERVLARRGESRELTAWLRAGRGGSRRSGDFVVERCGDRLLHWDARATIEPDRAEHAVRDDGPVRLAGSNVEIARQPEPPVAVPTAVFVPASAEVTLRARRAGDRIVGSDGRTLSIGRLLRAAASLAGERDYWPVVCVDGAPAWLPGARAIGRTLTRAPAPGRVALLARGLPDERPPRIAAASARTTGPR